VSAKKVLQRAFIAALLVIGLSPAAAAQAIRAQIAGLVSDESGAALPGVSVQLTSPALQVP